MLCRYANGGTADRPCEVKVNGLPVGTLTIAPTNSWESWVYESIETQCPAGIITVRFTAATSEGGPNLDSMNYASNGGPPPSPEDIYQTEDAQVLSNVVYKSSKLGYTGTGYLDMGGSGSYFQFTDAIDGGTGGLCTFSFRYVSSTELLFTLVPSVNKSNDPLLIFLPRFNRLMVTRLIVHAKSN